MDIVIQFPRTVLLGPKVSVKSGHYSEQITDTRWFQVISLLAFKQLNNLDFGQVFLNELKRSMAFKRISVESIVRGLKSKLDEQHPIVIEMIKKHIELPKLGPLVLNAKGISIIAALPELNAYIYETFGIKVLKKGIDEQSIKNLNFSLNSYELTSAHFALSKFLSEIDKSECQFSLLEAIANLNLARVSYLMDRKTPKTTRFLNAATIASKSISDKLDRSMIHAFILATQVWTTPFNELTALKTIRANNLAIDLAGEFSTRQPDKIALLAGRHFFSTYVARRFGTSTDQHQELLITKSLYQELANLPAPLFIPWETQCFDIYEFKLLLLDFHRKKELISETEISVYNDLVRKSNTSALSTLSAAEWIAKSLIKFKKLDKAYDFLINALIDHASLYQTDIYRRVRRLRDTLPNILEKNQE